MSFIYTNAQLQIDLRKETFSKNRNFRIILQFE